MEKEKRDSIALSQVKTEGTKVRSVRYNPIFGALLIAILGVLAFWIRNWIGIVIGIVLCLAAISILFILKNPNVMDLYTGGILVYDDKDSKKGFFLSKEAIDAWKVKRSSYGTQTTMLLLKNGQYVYKETFEMKSLRKDLLSILPEKEFTEEKENAK